MSLIMVVSILTSHLNQSPLSTKIDYARSITNGRVPIEMGINQTVVLRIVGEGMELGIINR